MYLQTLWLKKKEVFVSLLASVHLCVALELFVSFTLGEAFIKKLRKVAESSL